MDWLALALTGLSLLRAFSQARAVKRYARREPDKVLDSDLLYLRRPTHLLVAIPLSSFIITGAPFRLLSFDEASLVSTAVGALFGILILLAVNHHRYLLRAKQ